MENQTPPSFNANDNNMPQLSTIKGFSITSLVAGIIALPTFCFPPLTLTLAGIGLVFGILALVRIKNCGYGDKTMSIIGVILSGIMLIVGLFLLFGIYMAMNVAEQVLNENLDSLKVMLDSLNSGMDLPMLNEPDSSMLIENMDPMMSE